MSFVDRIATALGGGTNYEDGYEEDSGRAYNGHSRPTPEEAKAARRSVNRATGTSEKLSEKEIGQLTTGKHLWEFFDLEFDRNEAFRRHVIDLAYESGAVDEYNPDPFKGLDRFWVTSNGTPYQTKKEAQLNEKKSLTCIREEIWHIDEEGNPTVMATIEEQDAYLRAELQKEVERIQAEEQANAAAEAADPKATGPETADPEDTKGVNPPEQGTGTT